MSDPLRTNPTNQSPASIDGDAERDAKIESLLIAGLDQYFASHYAQAIDIWTRALFLDRNHARARAYIDRARSAMAEQQRESEELLHNGVAAFERGEIEAARQMLNAAVQRGGAHDVALAFLTRIDRIHAATSSGAGADGAAVEIAVPAARCGAGPSGLAVGERRDRDIPARRRGCCGHHLLGWHPRVDPGVGARMRPTDWRRCGSLRSLSSYREAPRRRSIALVRCLRRAVRTTHFVPSISCGLPIRCVSTPTS